MKKILVTLLALVTIVVNAQTIVPIYWPFGISSNQANYLRVLIEQANKDQKKYIFILEHKPGAGGSIAVKSVAAHNGLVLTGHTSSFFIRPLINPNEGVYNFKDFTPVLIQCTGQPQVIVSSKYKSFEELQKQKFLNIGVLYGSLTELQARQLQKSLPNTELTLIGYQGTPEITQQVLGKNLDLGIDLPLGATQWVELNKLNVIGTSGTILFNKNFPTFSKLGINGFENLVANNLIVAHSKIKPEIIEELHSILKYAARTFELGEMYEKDFCKKEDLTLQQSNELFKKWSENWPAILPSK
jgi:tripartite-type tricarboxylate transporter receptor subunit TctC